MAMGGGIYHTEVWDTAGWSRAGEVIGTGATWPEIIDALFQSAEHRRVLEDCRYDKIAIGFYFADDGTVWLTARLYAQ